ncbi:minor capsid protein [Arthrobacter phage Abba]|uniref:Minor capsid protein n=1 Tax=Arthrobacter phage Abba TaxID=2713256 RepID=A0A6G8R2C9_9CAUD|nr:minor capsid protein [Arthrobacter phage Abba]QIN94336.1 minor capsid protein [Arthrobacter phage Abba]
MTMFGKPDQSFEFFAGNDAITADAVGAVTGKTFVKLVAGGTAQRPKVSTCGAGERPYGVAFWTVADKESVTVVRAGVLAVTAGEALASADAIAVGAGGKAVKAGAGTVYGDVHGDAPINTDAAVAFTF